MRVFESETGVVTYHECTHHLRVIGVVHSRHLIDIVNSLQIFDAGEKAATEETIRQAGSILSKFFCKGGVISSSVDTFKVGLSHLPGLTNAFLDRLRKEGYIRQNVNELAEVIPEFVDYLNSERKNPLVNGNGLIFLAEKADEQIRLVENRSISAFFHLPTSDGKYRKFSPLESVAATYVDAYLQKLKPPIITSSSITKACLFDMTCNTRLSGIGT
jgi:hypothetical protein